MSHKAQPLPRPDLPDYDRFARYLAAVGNCTTRTGATYAQRARLAVNWFTVNRPGTPLLELTPEDIEDYIIDLDELGISSSSRRLAVYALRKLYKYLGRRSAGAAVNPAQQVHAPTQHSRRPDPWTSDELARLLQAALEIAACHPAGSPRWVRARFDHAVLATFRYAGLRTAELIGLGTDHVCIPTLRLEVHGKGDIQRHAPLPPELARILDEYLTHVRPLCPASSRLFANPSGYEGSAVYGTVAPRAVFAIVRKYATLAGLNASAHPHRLRHSYSTDLFRMGTPLNVISALLGHSNLLTTIRYIGLTHDDLRDAVTTAYPALANGLSARDTASEAPENDGDAPVAA